MIEPKQAPPAYPETQDPAAAGVDTSTMETSVDNELLTELATFKAKLPELLPREGEFVLIKGQDVVGIYPTLREALEAGAETFGEEPALIKKIARAESTNSPVGPAL